MTRPMREQPAGHLGPAPRILVIRLRRLGDILRVTPVLRAIRHTFPACRLDVLVAAGFEATLAGNPHIDQLLIARRGFRSWMALAATCRRGRYDIVLDVQSSARSVHLVALSQAPVRVGWRKRWLRDQAYTTLLPGWDAAVYFPRNALRMTEVIGVPPAADVRLELPVLAADRVRVAALFESAGIKRDRPVIALSVVARNPGRQWPGERYAALADRLMQEWQAQLVFTRGAGELDQVRAVVAQMHTPPAMWEHPGTTLSQLGAVYECCTCWIGNDGGPKHVAVAVACPSVTLVRPSDRPIAVDAADASQIAVSPPIGDGPTPLAAVTVDQVYSAAVPLLQRQSRSNGERETAGRK